MFLADRGDGDGAIRYAKDAIKISDYGVVHGALAAGNYDKGVEFLWDRHDLDAAETYLKTALSEARTPTANALYALAAWSRMAAFARKKPALLDESKTLLDRALTVDPTHWYAQQALLDHADHVTLLSAQ
jgi:tetratricopeptide (TPR) repeat protein